MQRFIELDANQLVEHLPPLLRELRAYQPTVRHRLLWLPPAVEEHVQLPL